MAQDQDGGTRGGTFHGEMDRYRESQDWTTACSTSISISISIILTVCPKVTGRAKETIAQRKRARAGSLAIVDWPQVAQTCILRADVVLSFSGDKFVLFCFGLLLSLKSRPFVQSFFDTHAPRQPHAVRHLTTVCVLLVFLFLWRCRFFRVLLYHYRFLFLRRVRRTFFSFQMVFFYFVTTGWIFDIRLYDN